MKTVTGEEISNIKLLRVGELARRCSKSVRALHLYEELGLLRPTSRSKGGFRLYTLGAIDRVTWIGKLQQMGFSLSDIKEFLRSWGELRSTAAMEHIRQLFTERLRQTQDTIARLTLLKTEMEESLHYLEKCHTCTDVPANCARCEPERTPLLVAEFHNGKGNGHHEPARLDPSTPGSEKAS
jgi:MerR family transcriptional regulator, copper efflux regulator